MLRYVKQTKKRNGLPIIREICEIRLRQGFVGRVCACLPKRLAQAGEIFHPFYRNSITVWIFNFGKQKQPHPLNT